MFIPKYTITNSILKMVGVIEASKEVILSSRVNASWTNNLQTEAFEKTICYACALEGGKLNEEEVQTILSGQEVNARGSEIQEILNFKAALEFVYQIYNSLKENPSYYLTLETILEIHRLLTFSLLPPESSGKPREKQVVIRNTISGEIAYSPPPAVEVPFLLEDLVNWVNSEEGREVYPVIKSAIIHFEVYRLHPFSSYNSATARFLSLLILLLEGYGFQKFLSIDEFFVRSGMEYFSSLQTVANQLVMDTHERDLTPWLEYYVKGFSWEVERLKETVKRVSVEVKVKDDLGEQITLTDRQKIIMEFLHKNKQMQNKDFRKIFPDFSDDTVLRELKVLKKRGLVKKVGGTKKATYVLGKE